MTCGGKGRPPTTLRRYSGIWSTVSGVPCASSRTALLTIALLELEGMYHAHHCLHIFNRSAGNDAVAEIENVAGTTARIAQNLFHAQLNNLKRREERDGIEVALHRAARTHGTPALVERLPPVEADYVSACRRHIGEQTRGFNAEVNYGHAHLLHGSDEPLGRLEDIFAIVGQREGADPTVEDLDHVCAAQHLKAAILFEHFDELFDQHAPRKRIAIHELLGVDVIARAAAF